ncbi:MAG: LysM peptidoglycan-binding domain-containing protein [Anaerolineae bacterium]|nr:LysM peptidoglycan-binding domain-containing protein [Anaerolineae bacterium]
MQSRARTTVVLVGGIVLALVVGAVLWTLGRRAEAPPAVAALTAAAPTAPVMAVPSPLPLPSPTPAPLLYTVQDGDTLSAVAEAHGVSLAQLIDANALGDPDMVHPGQVLVIPGQFAPQSTAVPTLPVPAMPSLTPLPTPTSSGPPVIEIGGVWGGGNLEEEWVRVRNRGGVASLEGWSLADPSGNTFVFPRLLLFPGGEVDIFSRAGESTPTRLYWGLGSSIWTPGELAVLRDSEGAVVDTYIVP